MVVGVVVGLLVVVVLVVVEVVVEPVEDVVLVDVLVEVLAEVVLAEVVVEPVEVVLQDVVVDLSGRPVVGGALLRWRPLPRGPLKPLKAAWSADWSSGAAWKVELVDCQRIPAAAKPAILRRISRLVTSICFPRVPAGPLSIDPPRASLRSFRRLGSR